MSRAPLLFSMNLGSNLPLEYRDKKKRAAGEDRSERFDPVELLEEL